MARLFKQVVCIFALAGSALSMSACVVRLQRPPPPVTIEVERRPRPAPVVVYGSSCEHRVWMAGYNDRRGNYHPGYWRCAY